MWPRNRNILVVVLLFVLVCVRSHAVFFRVRNMGVDRQIKKASRGQHFFSASFESFTYDKDDLVPTPRNLISSTNCESTSSIAMTQSARVHASSVSRPPRLLSRVGAIGMRAARRAAPDPHASLAPRSEQYWLKKLGDPGHVVALLRGVFHHS